MKILRKIAAAFMSAGILLSTAALGGCSDSGIPGNVGEIVVKDGDKIAEIVIEGYGTIRAKLFPDLAPVAVDNFEKLAKKGFYDGLKIHRVMPDGCIQGGSLNGDGTGGTAAVGNGTFSNEISKDARNFYGALGCASDNGINTTQFYIVNNKKIQDVTKYDPAKMRETASSFAAKAESMPAEDTERDSVLAQAEYYKKLAEMFEDASDEVKNKYSAVGGCPFWDGGYTVFGQVYEGFDVLDEISKVKLTTNNTGKVERPVTDIIIKSVRVYKYTAPVEETTSSSKKKK